MRINHYRALSLLACTLLPVCGCKSAPAPMKAATQEAAAIYPQRPSVAPPAVKLFHQDKDTLTLTTRPDATDDEIEAILWQFADATRKHSFDSLHLPQAFMDARQPTVWFHVYRGPKCADEKYTKGPLPCDASYHGAGDYTLGSYHDPNWASGVLNHADQSQTQLWNPDHPPS